MLILVPRNVPGVIKEHNAHLWAANDGNYSLIRGATAAIRVKMKKILFWFWKMLSPNMVPWF